MRSSSNFILLFVLLIVSDCAVLGGYSLHLRAERIAALEEPAPLGAPDSRQEVTLLPVLTSTYDLGSASKVWEDAFIENLNVSGTCTGCGAGSGTQALGTSSPGVIGSLLYYTTAGATPELVAAVATGTLSGGTGLTVTADRFVIGGHATIAADSGFEITKTASSTNWNGFYDAPSTRITAGDHIDWSTNTLNVDTSGTWSGNAGTATALAANGANCSSGSAPIGVDASGAVESCFDVWTEAENTSAAYIPGTRALTIAGTAGQITSSAGSQDLSQDRTWTLSLTNHVIFPGSFNAASASTTHATTTSLYVTDLSSALALFDANGQATEYAGTSCTNQFVRSLSAAAVATCASVSLTADVTGTLAASNGGTGVTSFGGTNHVIYTTAANTLASEAAFTYDQSTNLLTVGNASTTNATASAYFDVAGRQVTGYRYVSFEYATSTSWTGTTTVYTVAPFSGTLQDIQCDMTTGTLNVQASVNSTAAAPMVSASTTPGTVTFTSSNTFTRGDTVSLAIGTPASSPVHVFCSARAYGA